MEQGQNRCIGLQVTQMQDLLTKQISIQLIQISWFCDKYMPIRVV